MEQLNRLEILIGKENINKLKNTSVLILGLGGVGSYALESIVRSGIENVIIVDKDIIDIKKSSDTLIIREDRGWNFFDDEIESSIIITIPE